MIPAARRASPRQAACAYRGNGVKIGEAMTSILDIDLDYFRFFDDPLDRLDDLLHWAQRPVDKVVDHHHKAFDYWIDVLAKRSLPVPGFISDRLAATLVRSLALVQ